MNWIKQEHFTASASLHGVIILPLTLFVKLFDYLNLVDRPVMLLWSSLLCQVVSHISVSFSGLLSCSARSTLVLLETLVYQESKCTLITRALTTFDKPFTPLVGALNT